MAPQHVVVDGSNIATEGRALPSLAQLDEAVRAYLDEHPDAQVTVVVDATFGHRIEEQERQAFEEARSAGELVSPPAGAIGRGDAFLLRIAEKTGATVLSNDSFQEFHGEHEWLFSDGRLLGGVPVAGVGWIFTPRTPVRGPRSREATKSARRGRPAGNRPSVVAKAIAEATDEAVEPTDSRGPRRRRRRGAAPPSDPLNDPLPFIQFVAGHRLGTEVEGEVDGFSSHGAFVLVDGLRCYVPLSAMGDPPPRSARDVLQRGQRRTFVVQALDPPRRGIELALPGFAHVAGAPTDETVDVEIHEAPQDKAVRKVRAREEAEARAAERIEAEKVAVAPAMPAPTKKAVAPRKVTAQKTPAQKAPARKAVEPKKVAAKKVAAKKEPAKKAAARTKAAEPKRAAVKKVAVTKAAAPKKAAVKKAAPKKASAKNVGATKKAPTKKPTAKKPTAKRTTAKKAAKKA